MATPMSAAFSAGASFTPSPVMATTCPRDLRALTIASLCSGETRAKTAVRFHQFGQRRAGQSLEFAALAHRALEPQVTGNGRSRAAMVAGDHLHADAGVAAGRDGLARFGARRVDEADQSDQGELVRPGHQVAGRVEVTGRDRSPGQCQHAQCVVGEGGVRVDERDARGVVERLLAVAGDPAGGSREQHVGRALQPHAHHVAIVVEGGHELVRRVEGDLGDARTLLRERLGVDAALRGQRKQRTLGGVADEFAVADARVGAQGRRQQQRPEVRGVGCRPRR